MTKFAIITGGSKGIGNALALKLKSENFTVFSLARSKNNNLTNEEQIICDLYNTTDAKNTLVKLLGGIIKSNPTEILLINNAGTLSDVDRLENVLAKSIEDAIKLNLTIPTLLSSVFIKELENINCKKTIINISSGAATNPYYGWSIYCTTKAGIDMLTKVIAVEQVSSKNPVKVLAIYPGVVDTNMQTEIRSKNKTQFNNIERFIELKEQNLLSSPQEAATNILKVYHNDSLPNGTVIDVRNV
jgi:benzil reductase ((S)-benzoin forming)